MNLFGEPVTPVQEKVVEPVMERKTDNTEVGVRKALEDTLHLKDLPPNATPEQWHRAILALQFHVVQMESQVWDMRQEQKKLNARLDELEGK